MHPSRRRKKRANYGIRTVEVMRGPNGFGFTISGQQPCILSCIVSNSPADQAGLRAGDFLISVNGVSVSKITHDAVVGLIGNCVGPIKMTIAENYYSDSSDEEMECGRMVNSRKPKYMHKPRQRVHKGDLRRTVVETSEKNVIKMRECFSKQPNDARLNANVFNEEPINAPLSISNPLPMEDEAGPIEYKALVGYLGTIEMPKQLLPNSRLQTVCSCIRKLRQEKRTPTAVLMTILPTCLTLKNASNHILAIYPTNRVVYVGSTADRESRYFGLVTSAVCDTRNENLQKRYGENSYQQNEKKFNNADSGVEISNSCHVFVTDPKIIDHSIHQKKAESFKITCTTDPITGNCLEFPRNALYIVSLVQNMYKLQNNDGTKNNDNLGPLVANSPQPSASSNSDSGIGFRDDCGNISDRILVVEFPMHRPLPLLSNNNRPSGIDGSNVPLEGLDNILLNNGQAQSVELNNVRSQNNLVLDRQNNLSKSDSNDKNADMKQFNNLNNIRACEGVNIKNIEKNENLLKTDECKSKQNSDIDHYIEYSRLTCRAMPSACLKLQRGMSPTSILSSDDNTRSADVDSGQMYSERAVDVPDNSPSKKSYECVSLHSINDLDFKGSVDNVSMHSSKSIELANLINIFKAPFESKRSKKQLKMVSSCDNLDKYNENIMNYKLSPKVYGLSKPNYSCEELNNFDSVEKYGYGSLQDLYSWNAQSQTRKNIAQSEPDVRIPRNVGINLCDQNGVAKCSNTEGPSGWATSFEKLLEDPLGLHLFAEFLKKEFSAENIYFWTACERFHKLPPGSERIAEAQRIYQRHLSVGAPEAVNVDAHGRHCTEQCLQDPTSNLFDQAQKQIFNLMKFDSYPRFLKSDIYKQCLSGEIEKPPLDVGLMLQTPTSTPSKLKKSLSNAEDRRRKSLLPWHRKIRSKSKDRGEIEYSQKRNDIIASNENIDEEISKNNKSDLHSSHSSLTSLDLAITNQDVTKPRITNQDELSMNGNRTALCRVILSNGSTTVVQIKESETIQQLVTRLLDKRGIAYSSFEVFTNKHPKPIDVSEPSTNLAGCEVTVEQRVVFKLDLPNRKIISVKSKYTKIIIDVLRPILHKYQYNLDQVVVTNGGNPIDLHLPVTSIDGARLNVQLHEDVKQEKSSTVLRMNIMKATKLDEITNRVFEGILQEKADAVSLKPTKSDKGSVKSEDWGSEHSSGIVGKFLRRDSGMHERRKKLMGPRFKGALNGGSIEDVENEQNQIKKPLIAKWKPGANKLHVTCSESDELVEGLTRAQRCRLEDQRGTEINFELPDFLKDKENEHNFHKPLRRTSEAENNSRFYLGETGLPPKVDRIPILASAKKLELQSNYENRNVLVSNESSRINKLGGNQLQHKMINSRVMSPNNLSSEESSKSNQSTPSKCSSLENTVIENTNTTRNSDPPPLPPKPKIVPIKPPNWGQLNGLHRSNNISVSNERNQTMFLEQPSSSFV